MSEPDAPLHPLRKALRKALRHAHDRAERKLDMLRADAARDAEAEVWRENGEIIKAHLAQVPARADAASLPDLYHPGRTRTIPLDPTLKPLDNARKYFKKYRKHQDARPHREREIAAAETEYAALRTLYAEYLAWNDEQPPALPPPPEWAPRAAALRVHVPGLSEAGRPTPQTAPGGGSRRPPGPTLESVARRFVSRDGLDIWVGQSAADNDRLSLKLAKGNDWWLHIAHQTGSHVVVKGMERMKKVGERSESFLPQETLLDAAHLAVYYSKARRATRAEVDYTQAKHVRKSRGAPAGQVTLSQHRTLSVRIEPSRLERLLRGAGKAGGKEDES